MRVAIVTSVLTVLLASCTKPNPVVCCNSPSDCSSLGIQESSRPCDDGFTCVGHECVVPPNACVTNEECSSPTPFCDPGVACVGCLSSNDCPAERPTCDETSRSCRACTADVDCVSDVCDVRAGTCLSEMDVLFASVNGADAGNCTQSEPCSLPRAIALADQTRYSVKLAAGTYATKVILNAKKVALYGTGATLSSVGTDPTVVALQEGADMSLIGLSVVSVNTGGSVLRCDSSTTTPKLQLFATSVDAMQTAVTAIPCDTKIEQSFLRSRSTSSFIVIAVNPSIVSIERSFFEGGGGISSIGASIQISNSVIKKGGDLAMGGALDGPGFEVSFSTFVDTFVKCVDTMYGAKGLKMNSSILYNYMGSPTSDSLLGASLCAQVSYSVVYPQGTGVGATNQTGVLPKLKDVAAGDYHLDSGSPALDRGDPASTNAIDYDGVARPQGAARDSGAFEFKP
jgi:hypothetical protein